MKLITQNGAVSGNLAGGGGGVMMLSFNIPLPQGFKPHSE